jgi:hypothetical protein
MRRTRKQGVEKRKWLRPTNGRPLHRVHGWQREHLPGIAPGCPHGQSGGDQLGGGRQDADVSALELLAAGIEIQEFNRTMLHHKIMVVDRRWVTVGTANFDNRSFAHNEESNVCFFDQSERR